MESLTTTRLFLRQLLPADAGQIFLLRSDPSVNKYLDRDPCKSKGEAISFIEMITAGVNKNENYYWAITDKSNDKLIGTICMWNIDKDTSTAEIGFEVLPEYQGTGIATEAIAAINDLAFNKLKFRSLLGFTHKENNASIHVLKKVGFNERNSAEPDNMISFQLDNQQ